MGNGSTEICVVYYLGGADGGTGMDLGFKEEEAVIIQYLPFNQINQIALCLHSLTEL